MAHETTHNHHHHQQDKHGALMASGFGGYPDFSSANTPPSVPSFDQAGHDLLGLQAGMEMLGFPSRTTPHHHHHSPTLWRSFKPGDFPEDSADSLMAAPEAATSSQHPRLVVDDSALRCLFPSVGQGLSLSLCNPSHTDALGLDQSFHLNSNSKHDLLAKSIHFQQQQQQQFLLQDGISFFPASPPPPTGLSQQLHQLSHSKYLTPAQDLLNEFVNLGAENDDAKPVRTKKLASQWEEGGPSSSSSSSSAWSQQSLYSLDLLELQKRKAKLLSMLEEVDRRYRKYCEQMRAVVSSFESVAGEGAATAYSTLASKAMSRHFRCLRDGIVGQIQATRKAMGEKDPVAPGTTRGETPRLRLLDQTLRQHKAFQQAGMMESHPWRPQRGLPERAVSVLRAWLFEHFLHPYPSDVDKHILARQTGLSRSQVSNWFINARVRLWKPMVEEMYTEEIKDEENQSSTAGSEDANGQQSQLQPNYSSTNPNPNPTASHLRAEDQKPSLDQLLHIDTDSLSSIINTGHRHDMQQQPLPGHVEGFGVVDEMDFSNSYGGHQGFGGSGVSLTLGLQQHDGGGVSLAFSPAAAQHSLFFSRQQMEDCQPGVQFSILEGEAQNLPYRNLMGAQLLHDLAG